MRVALVVHKFPPGSVGGTEIYTQNLTRLLSRHGRELFVFYREDDPQIGRGATWEKREGFRAYRVSRAFDLASASPLAQFLDTFFNPDVERAFQHFLDEVQPHVVHFQHLMSLSYRLIGQVKRMHVPALMTLHDYWFLCSNSQLIWPNGRVCAGKALGLNCARCALASRVGDSPYAPFLRLGAAPLLQVRDALVRRAALRADLLIAPSRFLRRQYVAAGFPAQSLVYLENGIDLRPLRRYPYHPSQDRRVRFTYLGSLAWQKGVHVLVEAFRDIPAEKGILRIYGDPTVFPDYAARLKRAADPTNILFEGSVPNKEVGRVLAETDVLVVPSLWYENSPVVIQEARAAGVPVLASQVGALPEKVGPGGWLFPAGDVEALRAQIQYLVKAGTPETWRKTVMPPISIGTTAAKLLDLYSHAITRPSPPHPLPDPTEKRAGPGVLQSQRRPVDWGGAAMRAKIKRKPSLKWWLVYGPPRSGTTYMLRLIRTCSILMVSDWGLSPILEPVPDWLDIRSSPDFDYIHFDYERFLRGLSDNIIDNAHPGLGTQLDLVYKQATLSVNEYRALVKMWGLPARTIFCLREPAGYIASATEKFIYDSVERLQEVYVDSVDSYCDIGGDVFLYHPNLTMADYTSFLLPLNLEGKELMPFKYRGRRDQQNVSPEMREAYEKVQARKLS